MLEGGKKHIIHELGHVYDNHSARAQQLCPATICGGGFADRLNEALGGNPSGIRAWNSLNLNSDVYTLIKHSGKQSTAEFFADSFSLIIINPIEYQPIITEFMVRLLGSGLSKGGIR
jgi:hypothetical protein